MSIVKAKIKGEIVVADLADTESKYAYRSIKELKGKIQYLGRGYYYSIDGVRQGKRSFAHFWKRK